MTEHDEQSKYFDHVRRMAVNDERYRNIYAIPNASKREPALATWLKSEGLESGVLDINIDWPIANYHGMRIEMKFGKNRLTKGQSVWKERFEKAGYLVVVCYSAEEAIDQTGKYFSL